MYGKKILTRQVTAYSVVIIVRIILYRVCKFVIFWEMHNPVMI